MFIYLFSWFVLLVKDCYTATGTRTSTINNRQTISKERICRLQECTTLGYQGYTVDLQSVVSGSIAAANSVTIRIGHGENIATLGDAHLFRVHGASETVWSALPNRNITLPVQNSPLGFSRIVIRQDRQFDISFKAISRGWGWCFRRRRCG
jgi:hypothetical protein